MNIIGTVPTIDASDEPAVRAQIDRGEPAILSGALDGLPAYRRWSREYLLEQVGEVRVRYRQAPGNVHPPLGRRNEVFQPRSQESSLRAYLGLLAKTPTVFLDANLVCLFARRGEANPDLAPLHEDVRIPGFVAPESVDTVGLWMSGRGVRTRMHYDRNGRHNLNAQLSGRKEVVLVPPGEAANLYPLPMDSPAYNFSEVDNTAPDLDSFPRYADVTGFRATLDTGDLLFLPAFWYHAFDHVGDFNLNLNFWFDAAELKFSAVALRNEMAGIWAKLGAHRDEHWKRFTRDLDRLALSWSPERSTTDEALSGAGASVAAMPEAFTAPVAAGKS